jgi:glycosyltransferase involved in cell wall biosynthesis
MRIGIDARMLGSGFGLARYVEQLVLHLQKIDKENEYVLFLKKENFDFVKIDNTNFKKVIADIPWYSFQEQISLKKIIDKEKVNIMHFPHWNVPFFCSVPYIVTIHDLIMFHFPRPEATTLGPLKFWIKDKAHRLIIKRAVKKSKHIIVTSEFTKHDLNKTLGVPLEKMTTTYQAPFTTVNNLQLTFDSEEVLDKFGIKKPFVLYVGSAYPHKNLKGLLKAWDLFQNKFENEFQLVLVGKDDYFYKKLKESEVFISLGKKVVHTGFVSDKDLCSVYKNASLYVFPSFYEGFGLPPLEAMSYGIPVASSSATCLPEVLGEGALYFDPENYEQIADTVHAGLTNEDLRFEIKSKIRQELLRYSFDNLAKQTLGVYKG